MSVISAIATGLAQGVEGAGENARRMKAMERDDQRFEWEKGEQEAKAKARAAADEYATQIKQLNTARANGQLPGSDDNLTEEALSAQQKSDESYARAEDRRFGITPQQAAQQPSRMAADATATPNAREQNIFKSGGEGLYKNQKLADDAYYAKLYETTANYLAATGQQDKMFDLQKRINDMREQGYEPIRKAAAAAVAMGDPNALRLVAKASQLAGMPHSIDPDGATFDRDTQTYKGVKVTGPDGKTETKDLSAVQLLSAIGTVDAGKAIEYHFARKDADAKLAIEERKAKAEETRAGAYAATARDNAETNRTTRAANALIQERAQGIKEDEAAARHFGSAFGVKEFEVKPKDEIDAMLPAQKAAYEAARKENASRREVASYAQGIYSLNERKISPAAISAAIPVLKQRIASGKGADGIDQASGLPYVTINGKKILLPKD